MVRQPHLPYLQHSERSLRNKRWGLQVVTNNTIIKQYARMESCAWWSTDDFKSTSSLYNTEKKGLRSAMWNRTQHLIFVMLLTFIVLDKLNASSPWQYQTSNASPLSRSRVCQVWLFCQTHQLWWASPSTVHIMNSQMVEEMGFICLQVLRCATSCFNSYYGACSCWHCALTLFPFPLPSLGPQWQQNTSHQGGM